MPSIPWGGSFHQTPHVRAEQPPWLIRSHFLALMLHTWGSNSCPKKAFQRITEWFGFKGIFKAHLVPPLP